MSFSKIIKLFLKWLYLICISCLLIITIIWIVVILGIGTISLQDINSLEFLKEINLSNILDFINCYTNLIIRHILDIINSYIQVELNMLANNNESEYIDINNYYDKFKEKILTLFSERPSQDLVLRDPSQGPSIRQPEPSQGSGIRRLLPGPEPSQDVSRPEPIQRVSRPGSIQISRELKPVEDPVIWQPKPICESIDPSAELNDPMNCAGENIYKNKGIKGPGFTGNTLANAFYWNKSMDKNIEHINNILETKNLNIDVCDKHLNLPLNADRSKHFVIETVKADYVIPNSTSVLSYDEFLQLEKLVQKFDLKASICQQNINAAAIAYSEGKMIYREAFRQYLDVEIFNLNDNINKFLSALKR